MSSIVVATPATAGLGELFRTHKLSKKTVVLFDANTKRLFGEDILQTLHNEGFRTLELVVPARETSKSLHHCQPSLRKHD